MMYIIKAKTMQDARRYLRNNSGYAYAMTQGNFCKVINNVAAFRAANPDLIVTPFNNSKKAVR